MAGGHVFISYARDDIAYVRKLVTFLARHGIRAWVDWQTPNGQRWDLEIRDQIDACAALIVVMSPDAERSRWVGDEVDRATAERKPVLPLLLKGNPILGLGRIQHDDVTSGRMPGGTFLDGLRELVSRTSDPKPISQVDQGCRRGVWLIPAPGDNLTARPELTEPLIERLLTRPATTVGVSTALYGAGGFGKTTLARLVCANPRVRGRFVDGVWVTIGEQTAGPALAEKINDVSEQLCGQRPGLVDPEQAGLRLATLLDEREDVLLVLDDVWNDVQLRPFLHGGTATCTRLITTRQPTILPASTRASAVKVDQLTESQARALLSAGLDLAGCDLADLVKLTGRWPLLVQLARAHLAQTLGGDLAATTAVARLATRLREDGPDTLDLGNLASRDRAVGASVRASMDLLTVSERGRFVELGIFAEDIDIPRDTLTMLWCATGDLNPHQTDRLAEKLASLA